MRVSVLHREIYSVDVAKATLQLIYLNQLHANVLDEQPENCGQMRASDLQIVWMYMGSQAALGYIH